jgi:hypothetical protein
MPFSSHSEESHAAHSALPTAYNVLTQRGCISLYIYESINCRQKHKPSMLLMVIYWPPYPQIPCYYDLFWGHSLIKLTHTHTPHTHTHTTHTFIITPLWILVWNDKICVEMGVQRWRNYVVYNGWCSKIFSKLGIFHLYLRTIGCMKLKPRNDGILLTDQHVSSLSL